MLKALEDVSATKKRLKIEIPAQDIEAEIQKGLQSVQKRSKLPGFRPGKAPMTLIEKKFGKEVEAEVLEKIIPDYYLKALQEAKITPVSRPTMEESFDFQRNAPLSMTVSVEVRPNVENLSYEDITVKDIPVEAKDEDVEAVLKNLAEERATYEAVDDAVQSGDLVTLDYTVKDDGSSAKDVVIKVGSGPYPQEFFDGLIGKKKDEEFEMEATFPEDSPTPFAGKRPKFAVRIKDLKRRTAITIDDEFAKDLGMENLEQVKAKVRENILAARNREADRAKQREILDKLLEKHQFDIPESMLDAEIRGIIGSIRATGKDERSDEAITEEIRPQAEKSVRASILLEIIGEKEGVTVSEDELKDEILTMAQRYYISPENVIKYYVSKDGSLDGLKHALFEKKVLTLLLSKATIEKGEETK
ncbi:MAG: trigger factor [Nitrospirota bacterium]